ncbi:MAG: Rossmann-like and DUF2520 domain-containing protein [Actinomycetota bacterium]
MTSTPSHVRFALVGAGRVGTAVATLLQRKGHEVVGITSRTRRSAEAAGVRLDASVFDSVASIPNADLYLIGAPDNAIPSIARALAASAHPGALVCHFAGSLGTGPLRDVAAAGGRTCALHPVQACPDVDTAIVRIPGSAWGVTCAPDVEDEVFRLIRRDLAGAPVLVREEDRVLWHAAAVVTSNGIAALLSMGESILTAIAVDAPERVLGPLAAGTVANARAGGGGGTTLTGPIVRGEVSTVERHLAALEERAEDLVESYVSAARAILASARRAGRIDTGTERAMSALLETR